MIYSTSRQARFLAILTSFALLASACSDDPPRRAPATEERHENGTLRLLERNIAATIEGGEVHATFPLEALGEGMVSGTLSARLRYLGRSPVEDSPQPSFTEVAERFDATGERTEIALNLGQLPDETGGSALAAYTIDYRVTSNGGDALQGRRSLWMAAPQIEAQILAPDAYDVDIESSLRIIARSPSSGEAVAGATVRVHFEPDPRDQDEDAVPEAHRWFEGVTDELGSIAVPITPTEIDAGSGTLVVVVQDEVAGEATVRSPVRVGRSRRILLTTDKPIYQPSQTIHLRALALSRGDRAAQANQAIVFEIEDAKGNKVFKHRSTTDSFGIASAEFRLAREVNMGRFPVRAIMGEDVSEKTITVERYSLPKFAVELSLDQPYYTPGETVRGTVDANYTFGKPVVGGHVTLRAQQLDVDWNVFAEVHGRTDEQGTLPFEVRIPDFLVGQDLAQGAAIVSFEAIVTDTAEHTQGKTATARVADGDVQIAVVPESGELVPGMDNVLYIQTTNPAGAPVAASVSVSFDGFAADTRTGEDGFGQVEVPVEGGSLGLTLMVRTDAGAELRRELTLQAGSADGGLLLRTDKALYRVGETLSLEVRAPEESDRLYLDVVRSNRTVLTQMLDVEAGLATTDLDLGDDLSGSLTLSAYYLTETSRVLRDSRVVFVDAADGLKVQVEPSSDEFLPGEEGHLTLTVTDREDTPVTAALGLQIVDEAVFALTEMKPGLAETFFAIEESLQTPRVSVEGWNAHRVIADEGPAADRDRAAQMLFAATDGVSAPIERNTYREAVVGLPGVLQPLLTDQLEPFRTQLTEAFELQIVNHETLGAYIAAMADQWFDPWGQAYRFDNPSPWQLMAHSNGPDELEGSDDDVSIDVSGPLHSQRPPAPMRGGMEEDGDFGGMEPEEAGNAEAPAMDMATDDEGGGGGGGEQRRVRSYFPETLLSEAAILTDGQGRVEIPLTMADSITTWRASAMANTTDGRVGSTVGAIRVFQEFFIDPDLPATLTRGDEVSVPVAVYNYLEENQTVEVRLQAAQGFSILGDQSHTLDLTPSEVRAVFFRLRAEDVGFASLTVEGDGQSMQDAVQRRVEIVPDGKELRSAKSGRLEGSVSQSCDIPDNAVPGSGRCFVKVYPGLLSQAVEGLDGMLRMPFG